MSNVKKNLEMHSLDEIFSFYHAVIIKDTQGYKTHALPCV